ncbi:glycosyltransferase family 25 protein [Xylariaceae sp. FL1272]|nr:glycosyltransferase family 25 protein [Xylariaceae sp. FL1272]
MGGSPKPMRQSSRHFCVTLLTCVIVIFVLLSWSSSSKSIHDRPSPNVRPTPLHDDLIAKSSKQLPPKVQLPPKENDSYKNGTLGFSKIFVLGLPERTDKRDAFALTSALTGFHAEFMGGVRGESIPDKALPWGYDRQALKETELGSWRGHMNAVRRIVEENLESALIMEDDMDWDVRLKSQLMKIAEGSRKLIPSGDHPSSPYGDAWDVLWLGHCGEIFPETLTENEGKKEHPKFVINNDATVPPIDKITGLVDFHQYPEHTRFLHVSGGPICSFAYALSQRGARKVLYGLSVDRLDMAFDNSLANLCRDGASGNVDGLQAKCLTVTPPIFFHHRAKGPIGSDSDIQNPDIKDIREKGTTENVRWSARNNIRNMILGLEMESQF